MLIVGDFNVWDDIVDDANARQLRTLMNAYGLSQQVDEQTHREGHTLDHLYINESQLTIGNQVVSDTKLMCLIHLSDGQVNDMPT